MCSRMQFWSCLGIRKKNLNLCECENRKPHLSHPSTGEEALKGHSPPVVQETDYYLARNHPVMKSGEATRLEVENVFKIAASYSKVRELLTSRSWEFRGKDEETEMDSFRNKKTGRGLLVEDISEDFPVTFLMGELSAAEFSDIAGGLTPGIELLEVESSWEGKPTTIVVAMTREQVRNMFGRRTKMRDYQVRHTVS